MPADATAAFVPPVQPAKSSVVPVHGMPFSTALRCQTCKEPEKPWDYQLVATATAPIQTGDVCLATFWLRSVTGTIGRADLIVENAVTFRKSLEYRAVAGSQWSKVVVPFGVVEDEALGMTHINIHIGFPQQTIEVGGISVVNYGKAVSVDDLPRSAVTYDGREPDAPWRKAAEERIRKCRMAPITVKVVSQGGDPVPAADVKVTMKRHAFAFGAEVDNKAFEQTPEGKTYRETAVTEFNRVVIGVGLKWRPWADNWRGYSHDEMVRQVDWLRSRGVDVRGHNLVWPSAVYSPKVAIDAMGDKVKLAALILDHINTEVTMFRGKLVEWDVVNEPLSNHEFMDILGKSAIVDWYKAAHAADPEARLYINDDGIISQGALSPRTADAYASWISYLLENHAPLGGIGFESHFDGVLTPPDRAYSTLQRFSKFGLPLEITEYDVNIPDEQLQADYLRDYMTICFSHPAVEGFLTWSLWDGDDWIPHGGLYRNDWSMKPAGKVWHDFVFRKWWTNAAGTTDKRGNYSVRGFRGDYDITVTQGTNTITRSVRLGKQGATVTITL